MQIDADRYRTGLILLSRGSRCQDGRPTTRELCAAAGISARLLRNPSVMSAETRTRVVEQQARLFGLDLSQWSAWMMGNKEPSIDFFVAHYREMVRCTSCGNWFPLNEMPTEGKKIRKCRNCKRNADNETTLSRRLAKEPGLKAFYDALDDAIPRASKRQPDLVRAVLEIRNAGRAVTKPQIARMMGLSRRQVDEKWKDAGLPPKRGPEHKRRRDLATATCS